MIDPKKQHEIEQSTAQFIEFFPPMLWQFYQELNQQGFTKEQAFTLTQSYLMAIVTPRGGSDA